MPATTKRKTTKKKVAKRKAAVRKVVKKVIVKKATVASQRKKKKKRAKAKEPRRNAKGQLLERPPWAPKKGDSIPHGRRKLIGFLDRVIREIVEDDCVQEAFRRKLRMLAKTDPQAFVKFCLLFVTKQSLEKDISTGKQIKLIMAPLGIEVPKEKTFDE